MREFIKLPHLFGIIVLLGVFGAWLVPYLMELRAHYPLQTWWYNFPISCGETKSVPKIGGWVFPVVLPIFCLGYYFCRSFGWEKLRMLISVKYVAD